MGGWNEDPITGGAVNGGVVVDAVLEAVVPITGGANHAVPEAGAPEAAPEGAAEDGEVGGDAPASDVPPVPTVPPTPPVIPTR